MHDLRHTVATLLYSAGAQTKAVSDHLGHASIQITADLYTGRAAGVLRDNAARLEDMLHPAREAESDAR